MEEGKIIRCCADCVYYNKKKHLCTLGHNREDNPKHHFYDDCTTLEDLAEHDKEVIDKFVRNIRDWQADIRDNEYDADMFDFVFERIYEMADELKEKE